MRATLLDAACAAAIVLFAGGANFGEPNQTRSIDAAKSSARFGVQHVFVERVTGTVPILSGSATLAPHSKIPVSVTAVLDAAKIATADPDQTGALRGPDFFDVKRFPTWTFVSTAVTPQGPTAFGLDGTLTIHGVARPEHLDVKVSGDTNQPTYQVSGHIDRHAFGMAVTRLDPAIGDTVDVTLSIAVEQPHTH